MIRVPTVGVPDIQPEAMPAVRNTMQVSAEGMGANIGEALMGFGDRLGQIAQMEQEKANLAALNQARTDLANKESSYFDPNNAQGLYSYKGQNALHAPGAIQQDFSEWSNQYLQNIKNPVQRELIGRTFAERRLGLLDRTNEYALRENDAYQQQAYAGAVGSSLSAWTTAAKAGDIAGAQAAQTEGVNTIKQFAQAQGWPDDYTQYTIDKFTKSGQAANEAANYAAAEQYALQNPEGAMHDASARLGIGPYTPDNQPFSGDASAPRGIRNNNPGNIKKSAMSWDGAIPGADPSFVSFGSPAAGIRALALNAYHMQQHDGAQTVGDLISRWAPEADHNDTQAYIADVSKQMGVNPSTPIDLQDPTQLTSLTNAIITHENGQNPYSPQLIQQGVDAALGKGKLPETHPAATVGAGGLVVPGDGAATPVEKLNTSGNRYIDGLNTAQTIDIYNRAREAVNRGQVNMRASIEQRVRDDTAAFQSGQQVKQPLTLTEFTQAYGDQQGMTAYGAYSANQQLGKDLQTVNTLTPEQMQNLAAARNPAPGQNFAVKQADQKILAQAMGQTLTARMKDPVQWAQDAGIGNLKPLDLSAPDKLAGSIAARIAPMQTLSRQFEMPMRILSGTEKSALSQTINGMPALQKAAFLGALSTKMQGPAYDQVLQAIGANSPVAATAGRIMGAGHAVQTGTTGSLWWKQPTDMQPADVAETMLTGEALITGTPLVTPSKGDKTTPATPKTPKFAMPSDSGTMGLRSTWSAIAGDAFRGDGAGEAQAYQAYRAMYAGLAAKQGKTDGVLDSNIAQEAARATLGNVVDWDGHNVIPPYGMDQSAFTDAVNKQWQAVRGNVPGADDEDASAFTLDRLGPNAYTLSSAGAPVRGKDGKPVVLRIAYPAGDPTAAAQPQQAAKQPAQPQAPVTLGQQVMANINGNG